jgi:hypothetical protein
MAKNTRKAGSKKLSLSKETLRQLTHQDLADVRGGSRIPTPDCGAVEEL